MTVWRELLAEASRRLREAGLDSPDMDARRIVEEASGWEGAEHHRHLDDAATVGAVARFDAMVARRLTGEPLQYVLGRWAFRTLDLMVDRRVLIPRPETEAMVDHALDHLDRLGVAEERVAVDLGTGSGAIALAIVAERPDVTVWAVDRSADALAVARANLAGLGGRAAARVRLVEGDWYRGLPGKLAGRVGLIVSNPPYVPEGDPLPSVVSEWEPLGALVPGPSGLEALEVIVAGAGRWLMPGGGLVMEIGESQGDAALALARAAGLVEAAVHPDLNRRPRTLVARRADQR